MPPTQVKVPQEDGEIIVTPGGGKPQRFAVTKHIVETDEAGAALLLATVDGSSVAKPKPPASTP